jgi:hypothetical protein
LSIVNRKWCKILTHKTSNIGFGNLTGLRPVTNNNTTATTAAIEEDNKKEFIIDVVEDDSTTNKTTDHNKILRITPNTFERLRQYSARNNSKQPISYDEIFNELLDFYNEKNETNSYFHLSRI